MAGGTVTTDEPAISQKTFEDARQKLDLAIREFYDTILPDTYVEGWWLVTDRAALDAGQNSGVPDSLNYQCSVSLDNDWIRRRGILEIAYQHEHDMQSIRARRWAEGSGQ